MSAPSRRTRAGRTKSASRPGRAPAAAGTPAVAVPPELLHHSLAGSAQRRPDAVALLADGREVTFGELDRWTVRIAARLRRDGLQRGDRVAVVADNSAETVAAVFAAMAAGGVAVPMSPLARREKLSQLVLDSGAAAIVAPPSSAAAVRAAAAEASGLRSLLWTGALPDDGSSGGPVSASEGAFPEILASAAEVPPGPDLGADDLCLILYTSGTTGRSKGVMLTHANLVNTTGVVAGYLGNVPEDVVSCVLPLSHTYGLLQVLVGARVGHAVLLERSFAFPWEVLRRIGEHRVTGFPGVPAIWAKILALGSLEGLDLSSLRYLTNAAAPLAPAQIRRLRALFPDAAFHSMYGLTECTRACTLDPARIDDKTASVGTAIANSEAWVADEAGRRLPPGVVGELVIRGANVMRGYWGRPDETAAVLRDGDAPGGKVLHTGDLFRTDEEGFLYHVGRVDDVFKCRGEKVAPREVEDVLLALEGVAEAAVAGVADADDGAAVRAFVVLRPGPRLVERDVRRHCARHLESHLVPKSVVFLDALPRTEGGKLDRKALARLPARPADPGR